MDYEEFEAAPGLVCRGPRPASLEPGEYIACAGAAQTFGPHCWKPYPALLSERLGVPVLNLGLGGAGPRMFTSDPSAIQFMNDARMVVVQVLSGRTESNSRMVSPRGSHKVNFGSGKGQWALPLWRRLFKSAPEAEVRSLIDETRANWLRSFRELLSVIERPKLLFWFSRRTPAYSEDYSLGLRRVTGGFPHFVNEAMVAELRPLADAYVECVTARGWPLILRRKDGSPLKVRHESVRAMVSSRSFRHVVRNRYYPSPEMHADAAAALTPVCRALL